MYNEDEVLFARTMTGVFKNINYLCGRSRSTTWGQDAWKKVVVCVVSDGRAKINPRTRSVLAGMGCYQEGIAKSSVNNKDVTAHIYEVNYNGLLRGWVCHTECSIVYHSSRHRCPRRCSKACSWWERWQHMPSAVALLLEGEEPEENQLSQMVFPSIWPST